MEAVDVEFHNSLKYIKDNDPEPLCLTFSVNKTVFGEVSVYTYCLLLNDICQVLEEELKPGGKDIELTQSNKDEYIK